MDIVEQSSFRTSDGREIALIPGWFELLKPGSWPYGAKDFRTFVEDSILDGKPYPTDPGFILNKLITANAMKNLVEESGRDLDGSARHLDICTGPAVLPRAFKALGLTGEAHGIDVLDRRGDCPDERLLAIWRENRDTIDAPGAENGKRIFDLFERTNSLQTGINNCFEMLFRVGDIKNDLSMDAYTVGDFLEYEAPAPFDLVTVTAGIEFFDPDEFFAKLSEMMAPGGIFATFNDYFYQMFGGSMSMPMDAPWLHARVTREDLFRYYREFRPDIADIAEKAVYFPATHKTAKDYVRAAARHGLELVSFRRQMQPYIIRDLLFENPFMRELFFTTVVPDCQVINDSVEPSDLFTYYLNMVLRKAA